jgi:hypothetical protein
MAGTDVGRGRPDRAPPEDRDGGPREDTAPRFEFRVFGGNLEASHHRLAELGEPGSLEMREDLYLVVRDRPDRGLKFRGSAGRLELKSLVRLEDGCELWRPADSAELPLSGRKISRRFLEPAGVPGLCADQDRYDRRDLLAALGPMEMVRQVPVRKRRRKFRLAGASGEWAEFAYPDATSEFGIALESPEIARLRELVPALGLAERKNVSLPRRLQSIAFPKL